MRMVNTTFFTAAPRFTPVIGRFSANSCPTQKKTALGGLLRERFAQICLIQEVSEAVELRDHFVFTIPCGGHQHCAIYTGDEGLRA